MAPVSGSCVKAEPDTLDQADPAGLAELQCASAAIRPLGVTGKVPVSHGKDGRHPKYENHGRIAGR